MSGIYSPIELGIIISFSGLFFSLLVYTMSLKKEFKEMEVNLSAFKKDTEKALYFSEQRKISHDLELLKEAQNNGPNCEILILGINGLGILHQGYESIIENLNIGNKILILLLSPDINGYFGERITNESKNITETDLNFTKNRLISEWNTSMMIIADILNKTNLPKNLVIKKYNKSVNYGITGVICTKKDNKEMEFSNVMMNCYSDSGRGYQNRQFICRSGVMAEKIVLEKSINTFRKIWENPETKKIEQISEELQSLDPHT